MTTRRARRGGRDRRGRLHRLAPVRTTAGRRLARDRRRLLHRLLPTRRQAVEPHGSLTVTRLRPAGARPAGRRLAGGPVRGGRRVPPGRPGRRPRQLRPELPATMPTTTSSPRNACSRRLGPPVPRGSCGHRPRRSTATRRHTRVARHRPPPCRGRRTASRSGPARTSRGSIGARTWPSPDSVTSLSTVPGSGRTWRCVASAMPSPSAAPSSCTATGRSRVTSRTWPTLWTRR